MTVLNIANDGYFNVLIVLYKAVYIFKSMNKEKLISLCSIEGDDSRKRISQTLNRWLQLGLFIEKDNKIYLAKIEDSNSKKSKAVINSDISKQLRRIIFDEKNNENFWNSEGTLSADLTRGLSFLLAQDIYHTKISSHPSVQKLEQDQVSNDEYRMLQNDVRWNGLRSWGIFLGFLWNANTLMPDPTRALNEDLDLIFGDIETYTASDFIYRISEVLPVLDSGRYRLEVESNLDSSQWKKPIREDMLSTSLSRALWRLRQREILKFEIRSDAIDSRTLQRADGQDWFKFTHVTYIGEGK